MFDSRVMNPGKAIALRTAMNLKKQQVGQYTNECYVNRWELYKAACLHDGRYTSTLESNEC